MKEDPRPQAAQNAPGFNDPIDSDDGGAERVFDITADLTISPVKDEPDNTVDAAGIAAIKFIPPKPRPASLPSHTVNITPKGQSVRTTPLETPVTPTAPVMPVMPTAVTTHAPSPVPPSPILVVPPPIQVRAHYAPPPIPAPPIPAPPVPITSDKPSLADALANEIAETNHTPRLSSTLTHLPQDPNLKPLRTYESDVAEAMARERASLATMTIAETRKKEVERAKVQTQTQDQQENAGEIQSPRPHGDGAKKAFLMILILIFIGAGVIGAYYLYSKSPLAPATPVTQEQKVAPSLVISESYAAIETDNLNVNTLKSRIEREAAKSQAPGTIKEIIPTKTAGAQKMRVGGPEMIGLLDIPTPDILLRSLDRPMMIGVYANPAGEKSLFVVGTSVFFQNTFAGMLQWESVMADDLKYYLFPSDVRGVANVGEGGTTTPSSITPSTTPSADAPVPYLTIRGHFKDRIIKNKDVRAFEDEAGQTLFLYSFVDNNTKLVLTNKESTLTEILTRLEKARAIR